MAGTWRKGENFHNIAQHFTIEMDQRGGNNYGRAWEAGVKGTGGGSFRPPCLPPQIETGRLNAFLLNVRTFLPTSVTLTLRAIFQMKFKLNLVYCSICLNETLMTRIGKE